MEIDKRAVKAIIRDKDGLVLVLRRSDTHPKVPFTPDLPGGTVEPGESSEDALIREINEEISVDITGMSCTLIDDDIVQAYGKVVRTELYEVSGFEKRPTITLDFEHDTFDWVHVKDLKHIGFFQTAVEKYVSQNS